MLQSIDNGLTFAYALMIVLAVFLILNTFLMNVSERRRPLAILRAIGATRGQLVGILLCEGLALGIAGTALGCLAGLGGARLLAGVMAHIMAAPAPEIRWSVAPFLFGAAVGLGTAVAAAYFPARMAGRISPLEGMRPTISHATARIPRSLLAAGLAVYAVAAVMVAASLEGVLPIGLLLPSGVVVLMASVIFLAALLDPLASGVAWLLATVVPGGKCVWPGGNCSAAARGRFSPWACYTWPWPRGSAWERRSSTTCGTCGDGINRPWPATSSLPRCQPIRSPGFRPPCP